MGVSCGVIPGTITTSCGDVRKRHEKGSFQPVVGVSGGVIDQTAVVRWCQPSHPTNQPWVCQLLPSQVLYEPVIDVSGGVISSIKQTNCDCVGPIQPWTTPAMCGVSSRVMPGTSPALLVLFAWVSSQCFDLVFTLKE